MIRHDKNQLNFILEINMKQIAADKNQIAFCGLYCGACKKYLGEKCPGCQGNEKASWCKVRSCNLSNNYKSCADCAKYSDVNDCTSFNNFISKVFSFIFQSDRKACIEHIKGDGYDSFAMMMARNRQMSLKRK